MLRILGKKLALTTVLVSSLLLAACGGGGSGGGSTTPTATARLTTNNALDFTQVVEMSYFTSGAFLSFRASSADGSTQNSNTASIPKVTKVLRDLASRNLDRNIYQNRAVNTTEPCTGGGSVTTIGDIDDATNTGSANITMNYCVEDGITMNGSTTVNVTTNTSTQFIASFTFNNLSVDDGYDILVLQGTQNVNETPSRLTVTSNLTFTINGTDQVEQKQLVVTENSSGVTASGALCISGEGCVIIETKGPVEVDYYGPYNGEIILHGVNSNLQILIVNGYAYVNLDADGNGTFETTSLEAYARNL